MHSFEVHLNESACRKSGRLGLEQVIILTCVIGYIIQQLKFITIHSVLFRNLKKEFTPETSITRLKNLSGKQHNKVL